MAIRPFSAAFLALALGAAAADAAPPAAASSPTDIRPLLIGSQVPDVTLHDDAGKPVELRQLVAQRPTVLIFYRGGW